MGSNGLLYVNPSPTADERNLANYIVSRTNCSTSVDKEDSPSMIRDAAHSYGINSITLEVERDDTPVMTASMAEYKMLTAATQYLGFP